LHQPGGLISRAISRPTAFVWECAAQYADGDVVLDGERQAWAALGTGGADAPCG
jgi:hypothetical protein